MSRSASVDHSPSSHAQGYVFHTSNSYLLHPIPSLTVTFFPGGYGHDPSEDDQNPFNNPPPPMDPRYHDRSPSPVGHPGYNPGYTGTSPSPGPHMQPHGGAYQLQDRPAPMPLQIPFGPGPAASSDRLAAQPTVRAMRERSVAHI